MLLGRVTGTVTATVKNAALVGGKLMVVELIKGTGASRDTEIVALDSVGAGSSDTVLLTTGSGARVSGPATGAPVDATIVAIVDDVAMTKSK